jgi:CubicO group peptidase (beta-lactamase class C family)
MTGRFYTFKTVMHDNITIMMKHIFVLLVFAAFAGCVQTENGLPTATPEKAGMSSAGSDSIKTAMQSYIDENKLPGMVTMIARHGKVVHFEKYGMMDVDRPMQLNSIFRIASMTKPVTSVAVMMLYDEGYFQLDDPVAEYLPEFNELTVFVSLDKNGLQVANLLRPVTITDLLTHTSGLTGVGADTPVDSLYSVAGLSDGTLKEMVSKLSAIPLLYQPGTRWNYSRSTEVLGRLVEVVSGKPLDQFFKERIFIPLKMRDTDFFLPVNKINRVAAVYAPDDSTGISVILKPDTATLSVLPVFLSGNGGLVSTATDYMIFLQMLLNKGEYNGVRLLQSTTVDMMTSDKISGIIMPDDDFFGPLMSAMGFGFGFAVLIDDNPTGKTGTEGSYWWSGAGNTYFYVDPREELILILMTQFVPNFYYPVFEEFKSLAYKAVID